MENIWLGLNTYHTVTLTTTDSSGNNYTPSGIIYCNIWKVSTTGTYTQVVTAGVASVFGATVGNYAYNWNITTAQGPGDYIVRWTFTGPTGAQRYQLTTAQLIDLDFMGNGGSALGSLNLLDLNTSEPKEGVVLWLQLTPIAGSKKSTSKITDSFGYAKWNASNGTYYVWSEAFDTWIGTLVVSGTSPSVFTVNPALTA